MTKGIKDLRLDYTVYPILFEIGPVKLYTYGLMMALGFLAAVSWMQNRATRYRVSPQIAANLGIIIVVSAVIGGRVAYFLFEESLEDLFSFKLFEIWTGGMVFYGGFILSVICVSLYALKNKVNPITCWDIIAPAVALGHGIGRIGCLFAGCCYGIECHLPWAITFHHEKSLAPLGIPLHPTQIYESLANFAIIGILLLIERRQKWNGQIAAWYLALYALVRIFVERYRGDSARGFVEFGGLYPNEWLSTSTFVGVLMLLAAFAMYLVFRNKPSPRIASK